MIDPNNLMHIEDTKVRTKANQLNVLKFDAIDEYDEETYDIYNNKDFKKYIKDLEKEVRGSFEYQRAIKYLKEYMGMSESAFMDGVTKKEYEKLKIELHHTPFTLFDISLIVFNKRLYYKESTELEPTAKEIAKLHYYLVVGLVALTQTEHELVHNNYLFVPPERVLGNYGKFIDYYKNFMTPEQIDTITRIEEYSQTYNQAQNEIILQNNLITLDTSVSYSLPKLGDIKLAMEDHVSKIKDNGYQLLSLNEEKMQEECKNQEVFNNVDNSGNCVSFNPNIIGTIEIKR